MIWAICVCASAHHMFQQKFLHYMFVSKCVLRMDVQIEENDLCERGFQISADIVGEKI